MSSIVFWTTTATVKRSRLRPTAANVTHVTAVKEAAAKAAPGFTRLFINLGKMDSFFPSELITLLNSNTRGRIELGRIDLMKNFSFFEVEEKEAQNVVKALNRANWNGRKVSVEVAGEEAGEGRRGSGSAERRGGKRPFGSSSESVVTVAATHVPKDRTEHRGRQSD